MLSRLENAYEQVKSALSGAKKSIKNILPFIFSRKTAPYVIVGSVITAVNTRLSVLTPTIYSNAVELLTKSQSMELIGYEITPVKLVIIYGATWTASSLLVIARNVAYAPLGPLASEELAARYVKSQVDQSYEHDIYTPGGVHNALIGKCYMAPTNLTTNVFTSILQPIADVTYALYVLTNNYGGKISGILGGTLGVYAIYNIGMKNKIAHVRNEMLRTGFKAYEDMVSVLNNYMSIHLYNKAEYENTRIKKSLRENAQTEIRGNQITALIGIIQVLIAGLGYTAISALVAAAASSKEMTVSDFIFVTALLNQFYGPLGVLGNSITAALASATELEAVVNAIEELSTIKDSHPNTPLILDNGARIEFRNVSFEYEEKEEKKDETADDIDPGDEKRIPAQRKKYLVLDDISFVIEPGQTVAFVGASGAGKSTIIHLLYRFYDITKGNILINNQSIKQVSLTDLRRNISIVPQATPLFADTLANNVAYGSPKPPDQVTKAEVLNAIQSSSLTSTVAKLKKGLETKVGERGLALSGGQRQRVALARNFLKGSAIQAYDEATSALDAKTEQEIQLSIEESCKGKTAIVIAHRLRTLQKVDVIFVLENGKIVERGTHDTLMLQKGVYAELWHKQNSSDEKFIPQESKKDVITPQTTLKNVVIDIAPPTTSRQGVFGPSIVRLHPQSDSNRVCQNRVGLSTFRLID